ncbi:MAG: hypothetical protein DRJ46_00410 [Thermoprotei archaeon]|nr:MAG: hypothetical protein DRJ46_00410 [Thermoprotei archaeon]
MGSKKISISIPEELLSELDSLAEKEGVSRSRIIREALNSYLLRRAPVKAKEYPTVLWKIKVTGAIRLRSPQRVRKRVRGEWIVEEI